MSASGLLSKILIATALTLSSTIAKADESLRAPVDTVKVAEALVSALVPDQDSSANLADIPEIRQAHVIMAASLASLRKMKTTGIQNVHESQLSSTVHQSNQGYQNNRDGMEKEIIGENLPLEIKSLRPKSAYFDYQGFQSPRSSTYGNVFLQFRTSVYARTTITGRDSLNLYNKALRYLPGRAIPPKAFRFAYPIWDQNIASENYKKLGEVTDEAPYAEAQIWGALCLQDVEKIYVLQSDFAQNRKELSDLAEEFGIAILTYKRKPYDSTYENSSYFLMADVQTEIIPTTDAIESPKHTELVERIAAIKFFRHLLLRASSTQQVRKAALGSLIELGVLPPHSQMRDSESRVRDLTPHADNLYDMAAKNERHEPLDLNDFAVLHDVLRKSVPETDSENTPQAQAIRIIFDQDPKLLVAGNRKAILDLLRDPRKVGYPDEFDLSHGLGRYLFAERLNPALLDLAIELDREQPNRSLVANLLSGLSLSQPQWKMVFARLLQEADGRYINLLGELLLKVDSPKFAYVMAGLNRVTDVVPDHPFIPDSAVNTQTVEILLRHFALPDPKSKLEVVDFVTMLAIRNERQRDKNLNPTLKLLTGAIKARLPFLAKDLKYRQAFVRATLLMRRDSLMSEPAWFELFQPFRHVFDHLLTLDDTSYAAKLITDDLVSIRRQSPTQTCEQVFL